MVKIIKKIFNILRKRKPFWMTLWNSESKESHWEIWHDGENETVTLHYVPEEDYTDKDVKITVSYLEFNDLTQFINRVSTTHYDDCNKPFITHK